MLSQRFFAIFVAIIMILSAAGWALVYVKPQQPEQQIETIYDRFLSPQERIMILSSGRVLIEYFYQADCSDCLKKKEFYESFVNKFKDFAVLEVVEQANETVDQMIGLGGNIEPLANVSQSKFMSVFCELTIKQPRECLLEGI